LNNLFIIFIIIFSSCILADDKFFPTKGLYEVVGKVIQENKNNAFIKIFSGKTAESVIKVKTSDKLPYKNITMKLCVEIKEACNWKCEGIIISVLGPQKPMAKRSFKESINSVTKCSK
jgi:hypothetical protein